MSGGPIIGYDAAVHAVAERGVQERPLHELAGIVVDLVADQYSVRPADVIGKTQGRPVSWARHVAVFLLAEFSSATHAAIARTLRLDHTSVHHAIRRVKADSIGNPAVLGALAALRERIEERAPELRQRRLPAGDRLRREHVTREIRAAFYPDAEKETVRLLRVLRHQLLTAIRRDPVGFVVGLSRISTAINSREEPS